MGIVDRRTEIRELSEWQVQRPMDSPALVAVERIALQRKTDKLEDVERFYTDGIGLPAERKASGVEDTARFRAWPLGKEVQLEFVQGGDSRDQPDGPVVALHLAHRGATQEIVERLGKMGFAPVPSPPPYDAGGATTFVDPDGWRVVLVGPSHP